MANQELFEKLFNLQDDKCFVWPNGKAEVWRKHDTLFLFEISEFGGTPVFDKSYSRFWINEMIERVEHRYI